jgi:hypothetical protein
MPDDKLAVEALAPEDLEQLLDGAAALDGD